MPKNLNLSTDEYKPTLVTHIPPVLFERYQAAEKMLWHIRTTDKKWQTNLRIGRRDLQLRSREKGDTTDWKNIPMLKIPEFIPKPQYKLMKDQPEGRDEVNDQPENQ